MVRKAEQKTPTIDYQAYYIFQCKKQITIKLSASVLSLLIKLNKKLNLSVQSHLVSMFYQTKPAMDHIGAVQ